MSEVIFLPYSLTWKTLDLGPGVKAIGMELIETRAAKPVRGKDAIAILGRRSHCPRPHKRRLFSIFSGHPDASVISAQGTTRFSRSGGPLHRRAAPSDEPSPRIDRAVRRETFGLRAGKGRSDRRYAIGERLSNAVLDAIRPPYTRYTFCVVCELDDGWLTILSEPLWPAKPFRRVRPRCSRLIAYARRIKKWPDRPSQVGCVLALYKPGGR